MFSTYFFAPFPLTNITIVLTFMMPSGPQTLIFCFIDYFVIGTYKWLLLVLQTVYSSKFPKFKHQHFILVILRRMNSLCGRILCEVLTKVALMLDNLKIYEIDFKFRPNKFHKFGISSAFVFKFLLVSIWWPDSLAGDKSSNWFDFIV